ncbi:MAG: GDP-mannose 4,6-dehydratase [Anaerolineales bacterium]|nr:GDP-mannose 4,6-dehydratase [Anaerolineales bacterium]
MSRHYFITGGGGFIGSNYAFRLIQRGERVTLFDNLSRAGAPRNVAWLKDQFGESRFNLIVGDIRSADLLAESAKDADVIVHLAGQVAVTTSVTNPREDFEANALGTFNALEAARLSKRNPIFIYSSTNKVYGGMDDVELVEESTRWLYKDLEHGCAETQPLDFHSPYGCCFSADTDVLTRCGWKKIHELNENDEVLTYNMKTKVAEFQKPTAHYAYPYKGKMYVQRNRRLETCVTPNHKMLVSWDCNHNELEKPRLIEAQQIQGKPMAYLLAASVAGGDTQEYFMLPKVKAGKNKHTFPSLEIGMNDWLRFFGWYISEGHCYESATTGNCTVTLTSYYRKQEAKEVMEAIGLSPVIDQHHIVATSRQLYEYLKQFGKAHDKYVPLEIKALDASRLKILLKSLLDGDGDKNGKNSWRYTTVSRRLADDVQEIAIKCGMAASVSLDKQGFYRVYLGTTRTAQCNLDKDRSEWADYEGSVYCVEVPNSTVMVRQNGHAYFSGNSKGTGDQYVRDYARIYGLRSVVFRQSCIYGPRQFGIEDQGWLAWMMIAAVTGRQITIYGDGKQVRDVLHVNDLLDAYDAAIEKIDVAKGQIYNVGGGKRNVMAIWAEFGPILEKLLGKKIEVAREDWRPGDQRVFYADLRKAKNELGWEPKIDLEEGMELMFEWVKANRELF